MAHGASARERRKRSEAGKVLETLVGQEREHGFDTRSEGWALVGSSRRETGCEAGLGRPIRYWSENGFPATKGMLARSEKGKGGDCKNEGFEGLDVST